MKQKLLVASFLTLILCFGWSLAHAQFPDNPSFATLAITPFAIEGLTGDATGNLYTTGRQTDTTKLCPVWKIRPNGTRRTVGFVPNPTGCGPSGITFDSVGNLYIADSASGGRVWTLNPDAVGCSSDDSSHPSCASIPTATAAVTNVPGTNGLAFDKPGNLWTGDGTTGRGRVWKIGPGGGNCAVGAEVNCEEVFRIQPLANEVNLVAGVGGVGRDVRTLPPGTITVTATSRNAANTAGSQPLVANGVAFNANGDELFIADTARGAIWKVGFNPNGTLKDGQVGCDTTFTANTLCLKNIWVAHPSLEGTDGIALDTAGNIWNSANERNAIVVVTPDKEVIEIFRNPPDAGTQLRNTGPLEFPASPFLSGNTFCTSNSDGNRRDNSPNSAGEVNSGGPVGARGKISCMEQQLETPGLPLPID
ncbi:MAG: SMP-30/gluconolactonase/LRE family protein [Candidatus Binatia bacterium]